MKKILILLTSVLLTLNADVYAQKTLASDLTVSAITLSGCELKLDTDFNFGVIDFTKPTQAVNFPLNFAPHAELPMKITVQCTPNLPYHITYETEQREAPMMDGTTFKKIVGIILNADNGSEDFLLSYIYNLEPNYLTMLHSKNINEIADGKKTTFNMLVGLQNPLQRGYKYPQSGVYSGTSILTMTF